MATVKRKEKIARAFAIAAHEAIGQKRKYSNEPYWKHPEEVVKMLKKLGESDDVICAAWLHDVVEDTQVSIETITKVFGKIVGKLVEELTDVSKPSDGNRAIRKEIDRLHTAKASPGAKTIKLADLISNTSSIYEHDKEFAKVYIKEKEALLEVLKEGHHELRSLAVSMVCHIKRTLQIE